MTSIFCVIGRTYRNEFKSNYLRNKKTFLNFLLQYWRLYQIFKSLKTKMSLIAYVFPKLETGKEVTS